MAKGLYSQGMCVLLRQPVLIDELQRRLQGFELVGRHESMEDDQAPVTLVYDFRPEVNGHLLVTPAEELWPDEMGDPDESPERFVAWSLGQYGPLAYPGCLQRAVEQAWGWEQAGEETKHQIGHVRLSISYVLGVEGMEQEDEEDEEDLPLLPSDYDPIGELQFLTRAVTAVLELPQAICYFNPGGEVLRDETGLRQGLNHAWSHDLPPLDMWTNVRLFRATEQWSLMDTVGNGQFDVPDLEAVYQVDKYPSGEVEGFLRSASLYLLNGNEEVEDGDTADGPGQIHWMALQCLDALSDPPRPTIRWIPQDGTEPPEELLEKGDASDLNEDVWAEDDEESIGQDEPDDFEDLDDGLR